MKNVSHTLAITIISVLGAYSVPASAGLIAANGSTNVVTDYISAGSVAVGTVSAITSGNWSYLDGAKSGGIWTSTGLKSGTQGTTQNFTGLWCVDNNKSTSTWWIGANGGVRSDTRPMIWNYTVDAADAGTVKIAGSMSWAGTFYVLLSKDGNAATRSTNAADQVIAFTGSGLNIDFDLTLDVAAGNDISFVFIGGTSGYTTTRTLSATITSVPEPASLGALAAGGLALLAYRRK